jgi:hypothetical protein
VSFPLWAGVQLPESSLDEAAVRAFGDEHSPHLYMVCTRPKITVRPDIHSKDGWIELEFQFQHGAVTERERVSFSGLDIRNVTVDGNKRTCIVLRNAAGTEASQDASLFYQQVAKSMIPADSPSPLFRKSDADFSEQQISALGHTDLEVIYIGQSQGREFDKTALTRLGRHEKWGVFHSHIADEHPHQEMWIILLSLSTPQQLNMTLLSREAGEHDDQEMVHRTFKPSSVHPSERVNFVEAALINHFQPRYNDKFKRGAFPSRRHESYQRLFLEPLDVAAIELETWTTIGCRLYSGSVEPSFLHSKNYPINSAFDMRDLFTRK